MSKTNYYGTEPENLGAFDLDFGEYMLYQYLPVRIKDQYHLPIPLHFAAELIGTAIDQESRRGNNWRYMYVTAKHGYATPGNPLNRPGWHTDGFGTEDINYVWVDKFPTVFAIGDFGTISDDHIKSVAQFEAQIRESDRVWREDFPRTVGINRPQGKIKLRTYPDKSLLRLDDRVVHMAPEIPAPGGERSFFKVSFSNEKYNLKGNAHNYRLNYNWEMHDRTVVRNDPARAGRDNA